jgi:hypothetical protein
LGKTGTVISFRVGAEDAPYLVREFVERFEEIDLMRLPLPEADDRWYAVNAIQRLYPRAHRGHFPNGFG